MSGGSNSQSPFDRFLTMAYGFLLGAAAIYMGVQLIIAIWTTLLVIIFVAGFITAAILLLRMRGNSW